MDIVAQFLEKGGLLSVVGILIWLLMRADKRSDAAQSVIVEVVRTTVQAIERNTSAIEALTDRLKDRR